MFELRDAPFAVRIVQHGKEPFLPAGRHHHRRQGRRLDPQTCLGTSGKFPHTEKALS